ncbi:MAG: radical SAM protein [Thermoproteota archaeon]
MRLITPFDPWRGKLCTCPPKYSFSPYTGCGHMCTYCYTTSYIPRAFQPRLKNYSLLQLENEIRRINREMPISIANSSDPYTPGEARSLATREALSLFVKQGCKLLIVTKSDLVARDIDILSKGRVCVSITVTTFDERVTAKLEPLAPPPLKRIRALESLSRAGISTMVRLDPIIPGLNDDENTIKSVLEKASEAGVKQVVTSTYKMKPDSLRRIVTAFPELEERLNDLYAKGERVGRSFYMPGKLRRMLISSVRSFAENFSMNFSSCREGLQALNTAETCDGSHMLNQNK